jgi:hypothetical protein
MNEEEIKKLAFQKCYATTSAGGWIFTSNRGDLIEFVRAIEAQTLERAAMVAHLQGQIMGTTTAQLIENGIRALASGIKPG